MAWSCLPFQKDPTLDFQTAALLKQLSRLKPTNVDAHEKIEANVSPAWHKDSGSLVSSESF